MKYLVIGFLLISTPSFAGDVASYYHEGKRTANGEAYNPHGLTAASRTLPFGAQVRVTYAGKSVVVRINDRGPFVRGRTIDLSLGAAKVVGLIAAGHGPVKIERLK